MQQNNAADDTELYATGQNFLNREEDVIGSVVGYVPLVCLLEILFTRMWHANSHRHRSDT